jgi:hypothetical protein
MLIDTGFKKEKYYTLPKEKFKPFSVHSLVLCALSRFEVHNTDLARNRICSVTLFDLRRSRHVAQWMFSKDFPAKTRTQQSTGSWKQN